MSDTLQQKNACPSSDVTPGNAISDSAEGAPQFDPDTIAETTSEYTEAMPAMVPPNEASNESSTTEGAEGITAWHNSKKITALWSNASNRNSWIYIDGMGWKALNKANDSSSLSLTMMASHAEQMNATVNLNIASDGKVHEIYVW